MGEEVRDFLDQNVWKIVICGDLVVIRRQLWMRNGQDLLIRALIIGHHKDANRACTNNAAWDKWAITNDHHIDRVAIKAERVWDKALITRIPHLGVEIAINKHRA